MFAESRVVVVVAGVALGADERACAVVHGARALAGAEADPRYFGGDDAGGHGDDANRFVANKIVGKNLTRQFQRLILPTNLLATNLLGGKNDQTDAGARKLGNRGRSLLGPRA